MLSHPNPINICGNPMLTTTSLHRERQYVDRKSFFTSSNNLSTGQTWRENRSSNVTCWNCLCLLTKVSERQHLSVETIETSRSSFHKRQTVTEKAWWTLNHGETFLFLFSVFKKRYAIFSRCVTCQRLQFFFSVLLSFFCLFAFCGMMTHMMITRTSAHNWV